MFPLVVRRPDCWLDKCTFLRPERPRGEFALNRPTVEFDQMTPPVSNDLQQQDIRCLLLDTTLANVGYYMLSYLVIFMHTFVQDEEWKGKKLLN